MPIKPKKKLNSSFKVKKKGFLLRQTVNIEELTRNDTKKIYLFKGLKMRQKSKGFCPSNLITLLIFKHFLIPLNFFFYCRLSSLLHKGKKKNEEKEAWSSKDT
jgi:hypothetical protein